MMKRADWSLELGSRPVAGGVHFRVWAPGSARVEVVTYGPDAERVETLQPEGDGYFAALVPGITAGARYRYRLHDGRAYPDPASRFQPDGVHGPSEVVDPDAFRWSDGEWEGVPLEELVLYELHVGAFTPEGTFDAAVGKLDALAELGVTAIEVMPIGNFPGERNWGYDGVDLFAPATAYGGPEGFKRLVDAAHARGLAVVLDVVYNHLGPEGNYLPAVTGGRFFTERHHTPWGAAVNYDGPDCGGVRDLVLQNALYWVHEYHVDGLRLDATHAILDDSPVHLLRELAEKVHAAAPRPLLVIAEDERNERTVVTPVSDGGFGLDAVWADDLHHALRRLTAGDCEGYYANYEGTIDEVARTLRRGWLFEGGGAGEGERGTPVDGIPPERFVHCIQNHDQVGNRPFGKRLSSQVEPAVFRALSTLLLLSPYTPLLWMGQEWAATTPFLYFTDLPEELGRQVTEGRRKEFSHFSAFRDPATREKIPDPQARDTFERSKLDWAERESGPGAGMLSLYRALLRLRRAEPALRDGSREHFSVEALGDGALALRRDSSGATPILAVVGLTAGSGTEVELAAREIGRARGGASWEVVLATEDARYGGAGEWGGWDGETLRLAGPGAVVLRGRSDSTNQAEERE